MKKEKYDLAGALHSLFLGKDDNSVALVATHSEILRQTGLTKDEFWEIARQDQTIGQLKYRILGLMGKKKIPSTHIV